MLSVSVHKDIGEYTEKVVGKLSARTLACTAGGLSSAVAVALPVMAASMPFWLLGFWRPKGLPAERFLPLLADHVLGDGKLAYATGSRPDALAGGVRCGKTDRRARRASKRRGAERRVKEI